MLLAERPEFREARPQTVFMHLDYIHHWRHPIRDGLGELRDAVEEALDQGDQENAGFLVAVLLAQSFWVGRPLAEIDALASSLIPHIRSQPVPSTLCQAMQQLCLNLMGRSADPFLLAGESGYDERDVLPAARTEGDEVALSVAASHEAGPALLVRRPRRRGRRHARGNRASRRPGRHRGLAACPPDRRPQHDPVRAAGPLDGPLRAPGTGVAPQVGGGRTGKLRGTVCPDPGSVGASARADTPRQSATFTKRSSSPSKTSFRRLVRAPTRRPPPSTPRPGGRRLASTCCGRRTSAG